MNTKISQNNYAQNFTGKVYIKGDWPVKMKYAFLASPQVKSLSANHDIFAHIDSTYDYEAFTKQDSKVYKILVGAYKDNSHFNWLRDLFGKNSRKSLTYNYHSQKRTISRFDALHFDYLKKQLGMK